MEKGKESMLIDIRRIPEVYRSIFAAYPCFNRVQSTVFLDVFDSDHSVVLSAPTGSGKTAIFELAIVRQLIAAEQSKYSNIFQIVYISPMKALCEERLIDWHKKFSPFGINSISITGDSDYMDYNSLSNHNLIITTPEKWDSITRRWKENKRLIQVIKLFMIDEVHLLNEENRGATLEAMVCRMKTIRSSLFDTDNNSARQNIRFLAVSATFPNIEDVGDWLGAKYYSFESSMRPVKLNTIVLGFNYNRSSSLFKFDISLNYRLPGMILKYSNGKPTLIFCSTRKSVEMAAKHLVQTLTIPLSDSQKDILIRAASSISDAKLRSGIGHGVGYHHGGLLPETRCIIEQLFRSGGLPVLVTTSTLATGVNLPAHLVIIKSTKFYDKGGFQDYTASALLQMLGRAGRPQFDTEATALILTSTADKAKFENMVDGKENIESNLHRHLTEHLNAEIVLRTITDLDVAMGWLASTFLYIRARKNPRHYGIPLGMTTDKIDKKLLEMCQIDLNKLVKAGMASMDEYVNISPTFLGTLMAKYYISFESMKLLKSINGKEILQQVLSLISKSKEFSDMRLRVDEKKCLNLLNKTKNENSIRFPFNGKIKTLDMKINCIIQAVFGCLEIEDHSILSEAFRIMRLGERLCKCFIEYLESRQNCYSALLNATILWKCFRAQLWENSKHLSKQFPGVGLVTSKQLVDAGKTSFEKLIKTNPRDIEMITKKKPPFGNKIVDLAKSIPRYDMKVEKFCSPSKFSLKICLTFLNPEAFDKSTFVNADSVMCLLIGDNLNQILLHERYMHSYMLENTEVVRFVELYTYMDELTEIYCNFVSEDLVGIDLSETFIVKENNRSQIPKTKRAKADYKSPMKKKYSECSSFVQSHIDKYMKCKKNTFSPPKVQSIIPNMKETERVSKNKEECVNLSNMNPSIEETENLNPPKQNTENSNEYSKKYSLSLFEETIIEKSPADENSENLVQGEKHPLRSFTDEEILDSVEFLLDQNENSGKNDMKKSDEKQECENIGIKMTKKILAFDLDGEFSKLYDKYGSVKNSTENIDNRKGDAKKKIERTNAGQPKIDTYLRKTPRNNTRKEKLHSAGSFENALFNPKKDSLSLFRYQPIKRFAHTPRENDPPSAPESKRKKLDTSNEKVTEDMMENLEKLIEPNEKESLQYSKSIKWRSPLIYSPPVKFSPKIPSSFSFSVPMPRNNDSENSHDWSLNTVETNNSSKTIRSLSGRTSDPFKDQSQTRTQNQGTKFLLSDRENNSSGKPLNNNRENISVVQTPVKSQQIHDFFSSSFLEDVGYSEKQKMTSNLRCFSQKAQNLNTSVQSAGSYYHDMVAKNMQDQKKSESLTQIPQKPFFLNQNHLSLPDNKLGNNTNCSVISNNNQRFGQTYSQMDFIPQELPVMPNRNIPMQAMNVMGPYSLDNRWLTIGHTGHHNISGDPTRPEHHFATGNVLSNNIGDFWLNSANSNSENQNSRLSSSQQMAKYPPEPGNHGIYYNIESNHPQSSFSRPMTINNFPGSCVSQFGKNRPVEILQPNQTMPNIMAAHNFDARNFEDVELNNVNTFSKTYSTGMENRHHLDRENLNYHMNFLGDNVNLRNPSQLDSSHGFFLNQAVHPQFRQGPNTTSLWNSFCIVHNIFNCHFCLDQNYSTKSNMKMMNSQNDFTRNKSFIATNSCATTAPVNRGPEHSNEYLNNSSFPTFSEQYVDRMHKDKSFIEHANMSSSYGMQNYVQPLNRGLRYDSDISNTFGRQNFNIPSEMAYQELPVGNLCNGDQRSTSEKTSNKTFLLSKFLNSCDDSLQNHN